MSILYCNIKRDTKYSTTGHWFYHLGQDSQCAHAYESKNKWTLYIDLQKANKSADEGFYTLDSIDECKSFVSEYFDCNVVEVNQRDFPRPTI